MFKIKHRDEIIILKQLVISELTTKINFYY